MSLINDRRKRFAIYSLKTRSELYPENRQRNRRIWYVKSQTQQDKQVRMTMALTVWANYVELDEKHHHKLSLTRAQDLSAFSVSCKDIKDITTASMPSLTADNPSSGTRFNKPPSLSGCHRKREERSLSLRVTEEPLIPSVSKRNFAIADASRRSFGV